MNRKHFLVSLAGILATPKLVASVAKATARIPVLAKFGYCLSINKGKKIIIISDGNVGLGTTNPMFQLN